MNIFTEALQWLSDPANWSGDDGIGVRLAEHVWITVLAVALAALVAIPLGYWIGHTGRGRNLVVAVSGGARAIPSLGLLTLLALGLGIGLSAPLITLVVLAIPPLLAGAYAGIDAVPRPVVDASVAQGMSPWQVLTKVEAPLGIGLLLGGVRSATLQVVSTVMLAAYVGAGGLGGYLFLGLKTRDYPMMIGAALLIVALALLLDVLLALVQRLLTPAAMRRRRRPRATNHATAARSGVATIPSPSQERS